MLKFLKKKAGYISIETIVVAGLMLAIGVYALASLFDRGVYVAEMSADNLRITANLIDSGFGGVLDETPFEIPEP